jgi:uncharacterized protein (TIGR02996 family)
LSTVFVVEMCERNGPSRRFELSQREITIGRTQDNDLVAPKGNVSKRHARLIDKDGTCIAVDLKSTNGTYVNGRKITGPTVITPNDKLYVGDFVLRIEVFEDVFDEDTREVEATELRLLAAIAQRDDASRQVYADWLEEHGFSDRAEFLRLQSEIDGMPPESVHQRTDRMRELAESIDIEWRFKVARPVIENCLAVEYQCPKEWGSLATTERSDVRYCASCSRRVYYCATVRDARAHAGIGDCVAVDIINQRTPNDLEAPRPAPIRMGMMVPIRR